MSFDISGKLIEKYQTQQVTGTFKKREFVIDKVEVVGTNEYHETIKFQLTQDRCDILEDIQIDEDVKVHFRIRGRRWEKDGKVNYFNNLEAWRIEKLGNSLNQPPESPDIDFEGNEKPDDLPF